MLEAEWDIENGFFGQLRQGHFDKKNCQRCLGVLKKAENYLSNQTKFNRRLVALIWYVPLFMSWQKRHVVPDINDNEYEKIINEFSAKIEDTLGVP